MKNSPFFDLSRPEHAYALGAVAGALSSDEHSVVLRLGRKSHPLLRLLNERDGRPPVETERVGKRTRIWAPLAREAVPFLGALPGAGAQLSFPDLSDDLSWLFVRGLFEVCGRIAHPRKKTLTVELSLPATEFAESLVRFVENRPTVTGGSTIEWHGVAALDFLGHLYRPPHSALASEARSPLLAKKKNIRRFSRWCRRMCFVGPAEDFAAEVLINRIHPDAVIPSKERVSDSGYDLTLLYEKKRVGDVVLYGTGITVEPPQGWYFDVLPRSSIIKRGYIIANSVGVIDRSYRGELLVPLVKIDERAPELELPARVAQMIPRPIVHFNLREADELSASHRGTGGFGSSGA